MNNEINDVIVIGAGAAGLFAAQLIASKGYRVLVLEHNKKPGRKIQISGGGRCNFTNLNSGPKNFLSQNPHFCKSALARFTPWDMVSLVSEHNIEYYEKKDGQLFCKKSSLDIINMLLSLCHKNKVQIQYNTKVLDISKSDIFEIQTEQSLLKSSHVIIASGGLSIPNIGASDFGHKIAKKFGHKLIQTYPALVPFTLGDNPFSELSGVSAFSRLTIDKVHFEENILFTHKGLSGPGVLQISSYWSSQTVLEINLLPTVNLINELENLKLKGENALIKKYIYPHLSKRIVDKFFDYYSISDTSLQNTARADIEKLGEIFNKWNILPNGTEGYRKAEVTLGGVDTTQISSKTMESNICKSLFFIGEVLDITGHLGGHNFQWAWASASACASFFQSK